MGGSISALDFEHKVARKDFTLVQKLKDPQLGDVSQMKNKTTGKFVLMKEKEIKNIQTFNELVKKFTNRSKLTHRNLMPIYGFASGDSNEIFTTTNKVYVYFEYLPNNLNQAIKSRRRPFAAASQLDVQKHQHKAQMFEESELFGLMLQLVDVLEYLQQNDVNHGDIRPETCFISDEGIIKLVDRRCICEEVSAYTQVKGGNKKVFVTPVQLAGLKKGGPEQQESKYKADVFSLGMTLLECATLKSSSKLYNWTEFKIDTEALEARLEEVKERYSANLYNILSKMLILEERSRPDFIDLNKILNGEDIIKSTAGSPRASTIGDDVHNPCDVLAMTPKLMSVLPQTPNTCQAILIQNSFAHRPVPLPKNSKLSLKIIPKDEELQQTKEAAVQTTSSKITPKPVEKNVKNNNPKQFPARLKKVFEPTVRDPTPKQSSTNDVSFMSSKRNTRTNASHLYKGLLLDNIEPHKLPTNTSGLLSECRGTAVSYTFDSFTSRPSNFEQENHMLDKTMTHRTTNSLSRQSLENFTPKQLTGLTDHFHITKSTSVLPTYSQTPNSTYVYKSGYSNPFIPLESNSATSSRPLSLKSPNLPSYQSINDSRDSNNTSGISNPIFSKSASVKEFPAATSRLETSHSMANLSTTSHQKEILSEREQLLVEDILQKVLNSSGIKTTSNANLKPASKFPLESISMIASNNAAQANTDRYLTERKENLRDLYLSHRTNNSIDCNSSYSRGGLNGFGMKDNYQSSSQGYSSSFYNTDQHTFLADRLASLNANISENRGDKKTIFNREPAKITPNLYSVEADKSFGELRQVTAGTPKMTDYASVNVNDQAPRMSKLNGRSKSNNFVQARFFDKSLWSKNPFKDDYK